MAINVTNHSINTDLRDNMESTISGKANEFSTTVGATPSGGISLGGINPGMTSGIAFLGSSLIGGNVVGRAGITADMVSQIETAYDNYISQINDDIAQIENPEVNQAFKGSSVESAFKNLVAAVKETAHEFTQSLKEAEMQIIQEIQKAYEAQDTSIAGDINSDAGTLR